MENPAVNRVAKSKRSALADISNNTASSVNPNNDNSQVEKGETKRRRSTRLTVDSSNTTDVIESKVPESVSGSSTNTKVEIPNVLNVSNSSDIDNEAAVAAETSTRTRKSRRDNDKTESSANKRLKTEVNVESKPPVAATATAPSNATTNERRMIRRPNAPVKNRDPTLCYDILEDMYNIYYDLEPRYTPSMYMMRQEDINEKMRGILIDWILEVHHKFKLQPLTLWLTVNILDRYLDVVQVRRTKLQLVGVTALLIASKYEDVFAPEIKDCVYITDYAYKKEEVFAMETSILSTLNYEIFVPTGYHFLVRYLDAIQASDRLRFLAFYYAERNLQEYDSLKEKPHVFVAAALYAALVQTKSSKSNRWDSIPTWSKTLQDETGLKESQLTRCARLIVQHVQEEPETASKRRLIAAKKKYNHDKYLNVSSLELPTI